VLRFVNFCIAVRGRAGGGAQGTFSVTQRLVAAPSVLAPHSRVVVVGSHAHRRGSLTISADRRVVGTPSNWCAPRRAVSAGSLQIQ
jgi:hypothetical protein